MTSPDIQNDLLESAVNILLQHIRKEVTDAKYFAVMADECKDESKREIIGVSLRYFSKNQGKVKERAVGFIETADLCAASISEKILEVLSFFRLDDEKCVGFSFDGASVMSGIRNGVQAILKRKFVNAIYTHCHSHRLNLVMSAACRSDNEFKNLFDVLDQLVTFFTGTKRHAKFMELQAELHPNSQMLELTQSCDTRWTSRSALAERVLKLLDVIIEALSFFQSDRDAQTRTQALGLSLQVMNKQFIFLLVAFNRIFQSTDQATVSLQKVTVAVDMTIDLLAAAKDTLIDFRKNDIQGFDKLNLLTEELCTKFSVVELSSRPSRARKIPSHLSGTVLLQSCGQRDSVDGTKFRRLWYCALDAIIEEMNARFGTLQTDIMIAADACRPESTNFMILDKIRPVCELHVATVNMVTLELESVIFRKFIEQRLGRGDEFPCVLSVLPVIDIDIFPNIDRLYSYLVTLPMTSCSVERMFSTMNRIKTKARRNMLTERLSNLSLLSFETELTRSLDYDDIIDYFKLKPRRLVL